MSSRTSFEDSPHSTHWTCPPSSTFGKWSPPFCSATNSWSSAPSSSWARHSGLSTRSSPSVRGAEANPRLFCWERGEKLVHISADLLYVLGCVWKKQNFGRLKKHPKFFQTGFEQQYSFNFSANTMCSVLLFLQLGIMLITPTIYKRFDIQLRFHWSELQRHTWWLGFTAQIFFTSQKSKLPCCEIKLCRVLKEYAKISFLLGKKPNAEITDQRGFHRHWNYN